MRRYTRPATDPARHERQRAQFQELLRELSKEELDIAEALLLEVTTAKTPEQEKAAYNRAAARLESYRIRQDRAES